MSRRRRPSPQATLLAALVLAVPAVVVLSAEPAHAATATRTLVMNTASANPTVPFAAFDGNPPKVYDIDGDGDLEIIAQNDNQWVYVFDSRTGALLAELKTVLPAGWGARSFNGPEVSILEEGGKVRLILMNSAAMLTSYTYDSVASTNLRLAFTKDWQRRLSDCYSSPGADSKPVLADLDRDGVLEIVASTEESGIYAVRANGSLYWKKCIGGGNAEPTVHDLNFDGYPEVLFGSDGAVVTAMNGRTGGTLWSYDLKSRFALGSGSIPVGLGIGQLDGVGGPDVVGGARDSHNTTDYAQDHALLFALDTNGRLLWGRQDPTGNPLTYTHPIVVDAAGDGQNEIYWGDWNTIGHKGGIPDKDAWKVTGPANFYRYAPDGTMVWKQSLGTFWSNKDLALGDVDGDGVQEVLANGPAPNGHDGIWALDSRTGAKETFIDLYPWKAQRGPILADLYGDGGMDLVIEASPMASGAGSGGAIHVYDLGVAYSSVYPHLPYPGVDATPPPPPSPHFDATFRVTSPNPYWQQVRVSPELGQDVTKVQVRANGGAWKPMAFQSYGDWTSSYGTPAGTQVEFLATASNGATALSAAFTWLDGNNTKGTNNPAPPTPSTSSSSTSTSTGPSPTLTDTGTSSSTSSTNTSTTSSSTTTTSPDPGAWAPTFSVPTSVNEWWVEVRVQADRPVTAVSAQANGGAWHALALQSWGNWAKSFHVPQGSTVVFQATASDGSTATSQPFTWLGSPDDPFTATFAPKAVGNDWWVEAAVTANKPVAGVEAQLNGGAWTALTKQSWGGWAKSLHAPNGTTVVFRATSTTGATAASDPVVWT